MGADTQATESRTWEYSLKVKKIDDFSLMACAGTANYIEVFANYVRKAVSRRGSSNYFDLINSAIESYSADMSKRIKRVGLPAEQIPSCYPEAAFATNDHTENRYRIFDIKTPHPPVEPDFAQRVTVGSGSLSAVAFLKNTEFFMRKFGLDWHLISTKLASQLCWLLMNRIEHVDPSTSGLLLYRIDSSGTHQQTPSDVWGERYREPWSTIFLQTAISEIPEVYLNKIIQRIGLLDVLKTLG